MAPRPLLQAAAETKGIVTVEDHSVCGGIGEAVAAVVAGKARVEIIGMKDIPRSGKPGERMERHGLTARHIVAAAKKLL